MEHPDVIINTNFLTDTMMFRKRPSCSKDHFNNLKTTAAYNYNNNNIKQTLRSIIQSTR